MKGARKMKNGLYPPYLILVYVRSLLKRQNLILMKLFFQGYNCVDPPVPPIDSNLKLIWNPKYPPNNIDGKIIYICNAGGHNRFVDDYENYNITVNCLPENQFSTVTWPTCVNGNN